MYTAAGPKDTVPADIYEVTYEGYVAPEQKISKAYAEGPGSAAAAATTPSSSSS